MFGGLLISSGGSNPTFSITIITKEKIMSKKTKAIVIVLGILAVFGIGGAFAVGNVCSRNLDKELIQSKLQDANRPQVERDTLQKALIVSEEKWWQRCNQLLFMTKAKKAEIVERKKRGHEQAMREFAEQARIDSSTVQNVPSSELGILGPIDHTILGRGYILGENSWHGYVGKKLMIAEGTGIFSNPTQGGIFVMEFGNIGSTNFYPTPTPTGPVKIVAEDNGVLTLESIAGEFGIGVVDGGGVSGMVTTPGGATYYFDMKTRTFQ
jgi:hypothetical protein